MNVCENCAAKLYSFLVNDTMFPTDKSLFFRCNLLNRIEKVIMTIDEKIRDEKLVCIVNRKIALLSAKLLNMNIVFECLVVTALTRYFQQQRLFGVSSYYRELILTIISTST